MTTPGPKKAPKGEKKAPKGGKKAADVKTDVRIGPKHAAERARLGKELRSATVVSLAPTSAVVVNEADRKSHYGNLVPSAELGVKGRLVSPSLLIEEGLRSRIIIDSVSGGTIDAAYWVVPLIERGFRAVLETAAELLERECIDLSVEPGSYIGTVVNPLIKRLKAALLLEELKKEDWHLGATAIQVNFTDAATLIREIKRAGLSEEYAEARKRPGYRSGHKTAGSEKKTQK